MLTNEELIDLVHRMFQLSLQLALPLLLVSMIVGIIIAIFQAATSINEQTLTFVPKLIAIVAMIGLFGGTMLRTLQGFLQDIMAIIVTG